MNPVRQPFSIPIKHARRTILYIHGLMGSPVEFRQLTDHLSIPNTNFKALLLPGHGGSGKYFAQHQAETWRTHVFKEIEYHFHFNDEMILIGHSLGGLLALQASIHYPISGMVLINTALRTRLTIQQIVLSLKVLLASKNTQDPIITTYRKTFSISTKDWWTFPLWIDRLLDVQRVASQTKKLLPEIRSRIHIFQSLHDETVHPISADILNNNLQQSSVKLTYLHNSMHAYFEKKDLQLIVRGIEALIK
jgi:carboxylesterase